MEGNLIIVESPTKAREITAFLRQEPVKYKVVSSLGHIRDLSEKQLSVDVEHGFTPQYEIPAGKRKLVGDLKTFAEQAETVYLASDPDREGEAIAWHLSETLHLNPSKTRRITYQEVTQKAVLEALKNPRSIDMNLVNAQQARRVLDRLVGFELSPILWRKINRGLSAGRVQSVALRLVVDKEREVLAFKPEAFWKVTAEFFTADGKKVLGTLDKKFGTLEEARRFLEDSIGAAYTVDSIEEKEAVRFPAPPFTTATLQQEASRKLHFSVNQTMRLAQALFERGCITYMRTDSTNLSAMAISTARKYICDNFGEEYHHSRQYRTKSKNAQEAHEAIRPTFIGRPSVEGTAQEQKLYDLIWKRTVASQMAEARLLNTDVKVASDKRRELFDIQAARILFDGFLKLYSEGSDDEDTPDGYKVLPRMEAGQVLGSGALNAECKFTRPPARYTEASFVGKLTELEIGRPSTLATIISTLTTGRGYLVKGDKEGTRIPVVNLRLDADRISESHKTEIVGAEKGRLLPQEVGIIVSDYLVANFSDILDYDFTANVEKDFDEIAEGKMAWNKVISDFYTPFHGQVEASMNDGKFNHVSRELGIDPADGQLIVARFGQWGAYVQKGEGEGRQYASLPKGQLIENITLEDAIKLLQLPRTVGMWEGVDIVAMKGRFGPYLKYGDKNVSLPRGKDPMKVSLEECIALLGQGDQKGSPAVIASFEGSGITVLEGRYGPYIKKDGTNYRIPRGKAAASLTEKDCLDIIAAGGQTPQRRPKHYRK